MVMECEEIEFDLSVGRLELLEEQELESTNGQLFAENYCEILALYLLHGDLSNAKLLWKRVPTQIKADCSELSAIWGIGKSFWKNNYMVVFQNIQVYTWSERIKKIMDELFNKTQAQVTDLISDAYINISADSFCSLFNCLPNDVSEQINKLGWTLSEDKQTVFPKKKLKTAGTDSTCEAHLEKLTKYISFLEA